MPLDKEKHMQLITDRKTKLIETYKVTDVSVHDSQATEELLTEKDEGQPLYADSAFTGEEQEKVYKKMNFNVSSRHKPVLL